MPVVRAGASNAQRSFVLGQHTIRANARKRRNGIAQIETHSQGRDVVRSLIPFQLTEANIENVNPTSCKGGLNPQHDAPQRTFERKDATNYQGARKGNEARASRDATAPTYRSVVHALAVRIADKHVRMARMRCDHLRHELICEVESAVGAFLAVRISRFPVLARDLFARFACRALPTSTVREMHRVARRACDARMARMGGKTELVELSFFNLFTDESAERCAELDAVFVNARVDFLLGEARARGSFGGNAARSLRAHTALLEYARACFLASIAGTSVALPPSGLVPVQVPVGFNHSQTFIGKRLVESEGTVVTERARGGKVQLTHTALYHRILRLARFVRDPAIVAALRFTSAR